MIRAEIRYSRDQDILHHQQHPSWLILINIGTSFTDITEIRACISKYIYSLLCVINHPCPNSTGGIAKMLLNLWSTNNYIRLIRMWSLIHVLNSMLVYMSANLCNSGHWNGNLSFWWSFHHWLHWTLSFRQRPAQPVVKISTKRWHFRFSVLCWLDVFVSI